MGYAGSNPALRTVYVLICTPTLKSYMLYNSCMKSTKSTVKLPRSVYAVYIATIVSNLIVAYIIIFHLSFK